MTKNLKTSSELMTQNHTLNKIESKKETVFYIERITYIEVTFIN